MKVLHVIPSVGPLRGGPSFAIRTIASGLADRGVETHVATTDDNGPSAKLQVELGRPTLEDGAVYWYFPRQTSFYGFSLPFTEWLWRHASDYSLIHIHALFSYCSDAAAIIARRRKVPYIIRPLGVLNRWGMAHRRPILKRLSLALLERPLLRKAVFIHYTGEQERIEAAECGLRGRTIIIPNPVEIQNVTPGAHREPLQSRYPELRHRRIVLFLSRIDPKKGLDLLIPAFAGVLKEVPDAALVIAGEGDPALIATLRKRCHDAGIDGSVYWPGFLEGATKFGAIEEAELFVLPSYSENFGIAVIEAMAAGVPVVITDQVGIFREVADNKAGLVTKTAVEPFMRAMIRLLSDDACRLSSGLNAAALVRARFASGVVIEQLIEAYGSVLDDGEPAVLAAETNRIQL